MTSPRTRLPRRGAALAAMAAMAACVALAACTAPEEASDLPQPEIIWEQGPPQGEFFDTEWGAAYLAAFEQLALARAYGDYSDPDLIAAIGYDNAVTRAELNADSRFGAVNAMHRQYDFDAKWAYFGTILAIEVAADRQSARVIACGPGWDVDTVVGDGDDWIITRAPGGGYTAERVQGSRNEDCYDADVWIGTWETPIDLEDVGRDAVKMPLPREYYVELGVISE